MRASEAGRAKHRARVVIVMMAFAFALASAGRPCIAGRIVIAQLTPPGLNIAAGIAFDDLDANHNPLITDGFGQLAWRVSTTDASVQNTYSITGPTGGTSRGLIYYGGGKYYQQRLQPNTLFSIDLAAGAATPVSGNNLGGSYNFLDLAMDGGGALWMVVDSVSEKVYKVNRTTGTATLDADLGSAPGQFASAAFGPDGSLYITTTSPSTSVQGNIWRYDASTHGVTLAATTGLTGSDFIRDFEFDPTRHKWFGIEERRSTTPRAWYLVEVTALPVPEPSTALAVCVTGGLLIGRRGARRSDR